MWLQHLQKLPQGLSLHRRQLGTGPADGDVTIAAGGGGGGGCCRRKLQVAGSSYLHLVLDYITGAGKEP